MSRPSRTRCIADGRCPDCGCPLYSDVQIVDERDAVRCPPCARRYGEFARAAADRGRLARRVSRIRWRVNRRRTMERGEEYRAPISFDAFDAVLANTTPAVDEPRWSGETISALVWARLGDPR